MRRRFPLCCLFALLYGSVAVSLATVQPANNNEAKKDAPKRQETRYRAGTWLGRIIDLDADKKSLTFEVKYWVPYSEVRPIPRGIEIEYGIKFVRDRVTIALPDEVKIRIPPEPQFDERGRRKPVIVKKDPNDPDRGLPGLRGSLEDLEAGQWAKITLLRTRSGRLLAKTIIVRDEPPKP